MLLGYRKFLKDDIHGDTALDTASMAKKGVLWELELLSFMTSRNALVWPLDTGEFP